MNNNSLAKLLYDIEPKIKNIENNRVELKYLKDVYDTFSELICNSEKSYDELLDFYDQDFIYKAIKIGNDNAFELIEKYKSTRYLLKNKDPMLQELPQFKEAINFIQFLHQYLYGLYQKIQKDYNDKKEQMNIEEILNKYYSILNKDNIFVKNIDEFITFLDLNEISATDKLNIMILINKSNIKNYVVSNDIYISNNLKLSDIKKIIEQNQELLNKPFDEIAASVDLKTYISTNDIEENMFMNKEIYLVNIINKLNNEKKYDEIISKYFELEKIFKIKNEFIKQKKKNKKIVFIKNNLLIKEYLDGLDDKLKKCILKNLIDIENNDELEIPIEFKDNIAIYVKNEFVVKTVYTYLDNGDILVIGILEKEKSITDFIRENNIIFEALKNIQNIDLDYEEIENVLRDIKLEELVLNIDLDTLDVKREV